MTTSQILQRVDELFSTALQAKTGWGRVEIMAAYRQAQTQALSEAVDALANKPA